jgi:hypothetical protein
MRESNARLTELDAGVVLTDLLAGLVGEEHVGGKTTLGGVGVWRCKSVTKRHHQVKLLNIPFFFLPPSFLAVLRVVALSLGMLI